MSVEEIRNYCELEEANGIKHDKLCTLLAEIDYLQKVADAHHEDSDALKHSLRESHKREKQFESEIDRLRQSHEKLVELLQRAYNVLRTTVFTRTEFPNQEEWEKTTKQALEEAVK